MSKVTISIIVPAYNESVVLEQFHKRLSDVLQSMDVGAEIIYVNDGSKDNTIDILNGLHEADENVSVVDLSRNFGKEVAMTAGLDISVGDAVIVIDADLQDPPELIPELVRVWQDENVDVVYAKRSERQGETFIKKFTASVFYKLIRRMAGINIPENTGDYRLMSRRVVDVLGQLRERRRFMKGLFAWVGFKQKPLLYVRDPRADGETKWNYWGLWNFAIEGITSFTIAPLKIATYVGVMIAAFSFCYGLYIIVKTLLFGNPVPGYPSLMAVILFLGGIQLTALGIIGEYIGRIFVETKDRPLYVVNEYSKSRLCELKESK
jgi:polyisoprenyl-phosphate glycosyltransferase